MEIHPSARRHGVADIDMLHAMEHALAVEDVGGGPRSMAGHRAGPGRQLAGGVVLISSESDALVIHAMAMRPIYRRLLEQ